mmetsp:Transcript_27507/g.48777  ORF Transcript_27507/g.48777 Transcript_27507/m.48777 type:complete len:497 (-) Transcript_27507:1489-2979(-)
MPKKSPRRRKNRRGDDNDSDNERASVSSIGSADYLSESHTIDMGSLNNTLASMEDDLEWDIGEDNEDYHAAHRDHVDKDAAAAAERRRSQKLSSVLATALDFPQEKRSAKREQLLKQWFKALTQYATDPPYETVEQHRDSLLEACCQYVLYRGSASPAEQYAACRVLEAMGMLLASQELYEETSKRLIRTVQSAHRATPVRSAALRAIGMIVLCGAEDDLITESVMELCETIISSSEYRNQPTPEALKAAAFEVWTVLATTIHELYVSGRDDVTTGRGLPLLPHILTCLESADTSESALRLKEAAGQAGVYIHDARLRLGADESEVENTTDAQYKLGSWQHTEYEDIIDEITQRVYELAHESSRHMSKKAKKEQRSVFRDYLNMLQDNEPPMHVVQCRGGTLDLTTWKDVIMLEFTRRCLQGGFQIQLLTNPTLQLMLGANGAALGKNLTYSQLEKRLLWSKTSEAAKTKDLHRSKGRDKRNNIKNDFLTADGEDI